MNNFVLYLIFYSAVRYVHQPIITGWIGKTDENKKSKQKNQ